MNAHDATRLIEAAGGDASFAKLLGIDNKPGFQQRVNNWKRRGIPPSVVLENLPVFQKLRRSETVNRKKAKGVA